MCCFPLEMLDEMSGCLQYVFRCNVYEPRRQDTDRCACRLDKDT